jgi:Cupin-like domain
MALEQVSKAAISSTMSEALEHLIITYYELNSSAVDELTSEPSPLEFMRYVARNRPFVVRGAAAHWFATQHWNAEYLRSVLGLSKVNIAVTPAGFVAGTLSNMQNGLMGYQERRFRGNQSTGWRYLLCKTVRGARALRRLSQLCSRAGEYVSKRRGGSKVCADSYVYLICLDGVSKSRITEDIYPSALWF